MSLQKYFYVRSKSITRSAKGEDCMMQAPCCNGDSATVVWAHSNMSYHGKGKGVKSSDVFGAPMCSSCHDWYDGRIQLKGYDGQDRATMFDRAMARSIETLIVKGILKVKP